MKKYLIFPGILFLLLLLAFTKQEHKNQLAGQCFIYSENARCSKSICFISDSTYCFEGGCDAISHYHLGRYRSHSDTVSFNPDSTISIRPIKSIIATHAPSDSIRVRILNRRGTNISQYFNVGCRIPKAGVYGSYYSPARQCRVLPMRKGGTAVLYPLEVTFHTKYPLNTDTAHFFIVQLDMPDNIPETGSHRLMQSNFKLVHRADSLTSYNPDFIRGATFKKAGN